MARLEDYGDFETSWCPGCGNFGIRQAIMQALVAQNIAPHEVMMVSGIGQAAKMPHYLNINFHNGLHGRALPVAQGAHLANPGMKLLVCSGDGCNYGEGGNHFLAAARRNMDITLLAHDNQIYGLTKGQASPTTMFGQKTKTQPQGVPSHPFNPIAVAISMGIGFVARAFSGMPDHLAALIQKGMEYRGFALIDILQPCVSFNKVNTHAWYKERCYELPETYDPYDRAQALRKAFEFEERIPLGVIYRHGGPSYDDISAQVPAQPLARHVPDYQGLARVLQSYR